MIRGSGLRWFFAGLLAAVLGVLAPIHAQVKPLVLLIGIDGFRADYLERGFSPNLLALAQKGLWAKGLVPVFPSLTFPNHLSLHGPRAAKVVCSF